MAGLQAAAIIDRVELVELSASDAADVEALFAAAEARVEPGFLARRSPGQYADLLRRDDTVAVGARLGTTLIGYSACYRICENPYPDVRFLRALDPARSAAYHGAGTVIAPDHEGRLLSRRLFRARHEGLLRRGSRHFLGLIAVGNWLSLGNAVHAGGVLVGLARDETALNYVAYAGELTRRPMTPSADLLDWADLETHERMFAAGCIVTGLQVTRHPETLGRRSHHFQFSCPLQGRR
jgi:hypothetical protein